MPITAIFVVVGLISSLAFLGFALTRVSNDDSTTHVGHVIKGKSFDSIQLAYVEHSSTIAREGDAKMLSDLIIDSEVLDPDANCEFCTGVTYSPGREGVAAVAYQSNKVDLTLSKRIVFFARGQEGGEQLFFVAAGKLQNVSQNIDNVDGDLFPDVGFGIMSKKVILSSNWKRYQIGLFGNDLQDITHPFGFVMVAGNNSDIQKYFLKGITYDDKYPSESIRIFSNSSRVLCDLHNSYSTSCQV
jgi:hypothetical protein